MLGALIGFLGLETLPRLVAIPRLTKDDLNPKYVDSEAHLAFEPHPQLVLVPKPGFGATSEHGKSVRHNSHGFRGPELQREKPAATFRIACLGGSSTYGTGPTSNEATWPEVLRRELIAARPELQVEVLNAGVPTWTTFESLVGLAFRVEPFAPDLVIVYHAMNDASAALWPNPVPDNSHFRQVWPILRKSPVEPWLERSITYLLLRRYATDYLHTRRDAHYRAIRDYDPEYVDPYGEGPLPEEGFRSFERNLEAIVSLARSRDAEAVLVSQAHWSEEKVNMLGRFIRSGILFFSRMQLFSPLAV